MATSKYQSTHFSIYRFNIIPLDPNSFQADLFEFRSLEELLDKKNDIFSTIVEHLSETTKGYKISVIQMKKVDEYQYIFLLEAKRSKIVEWRQKNKIIPHFPTIWVAIDISPSVQVKNEVAFVKTMTRPLILLKNQFLNHSKKNI